MFSTTSVAAGPAPVQTVGRAHGLLGILGRVPYSHHLLVHLPIALTLAAAVVSVVALRGGERWSWLARLTTASAAVVAILTAATGMLSAGHVIDMGGDPAQIARHRNLALGSTALMLLACAAVWFGARRRVLGVLAVGVAAAATTVAAHFGADMLHPGLSPWSADPHHHGPFSAPKHDHAAATAPTRTPEPSAEPSAAAARPQPAASETPPAAAPAKAPAHDHSTHPH